MNFLKSFDWKLNFSLFFIMVASLVSIASTHPDYFWRQVWWYLIGLGLVAFFSFFDWRAFINYKGVVWGIYGISVALLVVTYFLAPVIRGIKGWIVIGPMQYQVSELVKFSLIILYASFFSRYHVSIARVSNLLKSFLYFALPAALIALQPDFGSALVLFCLWFGFLLVSGIKWRHLAIAGIIFTIAGAFLWGNVLEGYQKERIVGLFNPTHDPLGINYNTIQSKIAIGSAGVFGKGFKQGTQSQLGFLPEAHTDFIFAAFIEEWGLLAGALLVFAFIFMVFRILKIGLDLNGNFGQFICLGTAILFTVQFLFNVGSNLGLTPVIGVTFPFLSYGGSSVLTNFALIGIIHAVNFRRSL